MISTRTKYNAFFRQLLYLAVLITIGLVIFKELRFFLGAFLGAITIYIVFRKWQFYLTERKHWPGWVSSLLLITLNALLLAGLGGLLYKLIATEVTRIDPQSFISSITGLTGDINNLVGFKIVPDNLLEKSEGVIKTVASAILNTTYSFTGNIVMMLFIVYFMFTAGRRMEAKLHKYSPFHDTSLCLLKREAWAMIYSNAVMMPMILVAQTLTSTFIYWIVGIEGYFLWGFLTALAGLLPVVGTMLIYVPIGVYMIASGQLWPGIAVLLYGFTVISNTDNVFRILFMRSVNNTHPLVVILGVIMGIPLFGFWGIIFGPLLLSGFVLLIKIYYVEYGLIEPGDEDYDCEGVTRKSTRKVPKHLQKFADRTERYYSRRYPGRAEGKE